MLNPLRQTDSGIRVVVAVAVAVALCEVGGVALGGALGPMLVRLAAGETPDPFAGALEAGAVGSIAWLAFGEA
jgi:hypothetical protein